jgi:hypothetical protein
MDAFEEIAKRISDPHLIDKMRTTYPKMNPQILLSSRLISAHAQDLKASPSLERMAVSIQEQLDSLEYISQDEYTDYVSKFQTWKKQDKEEMLHDMYDIQGELRSVYIEQPQNEADTEWNTLVNQSIQVIQEKYDELKMLV